MHACVRACVHVCVRACMRMVVVVVGAAYVMSPLIAASTSPTNIPCTHAHVHAPPPPPTHPPNARAPASTHRRTHAPLLRALSGQVLLHVSTAEFETKKTVSVRRWGKASRVSSPVPPMLLPRTPRHCVPLRAACHTAAATKASVATLTIQIWVFKRAEFGRCWLSIGGLLLSTVLAPVQRRVLATDIIGFFSDAKCDFLAT